MKTPMTTKNKLKIAAVVALLVLGLLACGNSTPDANTGSATTPAAAATSTPAAATNFKVGNTVKVGTTWQVVVNGVKTSQGGQFDSLKSGDIYLEVDISLKNLSATEQDMSSMLNWSLKDSTGQKYTEAITTTSPSTPDGKVAAGDNLRGTITYEVPTSQHNFKLAFTPDIISSGQTIWDLSI